VSCKAEESGLDSRKEQDMFVYLPSRPAVGSPSLPFRRYGQCFPWQ